jgi:hypothetical protein
VSVHDGISYRVEARIVFKFYNGSTREELRVRDVEEDNAFRIPRIVSGFKAAGAVEVTVTKRSYVEEPQAELSWKAES